MGVTMTEKEKLTRKKRAKNHTRKASDREYVTISLSKKTIAFLAVVFVFLFASSLLVLRPSLFALDSAQVERVALTVRGMPVIGEYVPAKYLPTAYILEQVTPKSGYRTKIVFSDVVVKMVQAGVIDRQKVEELYKGRGEVPKEMEELLTKPSNTPIHVTADNSWWLVNLLWPLGLSNKMSVNERGPLAGENVGNFASTGGWNLGKEEKGGVYYNSLELIKLTPGQEKRVRALADSVYRPCCNNSTFFQDCNHGSAALGIIELGVAQGLSDEEIYKTVLYFNAYWFPQNYAETALYFQKVENQEWKRVDPKVILSKDYSSISGWLANVDTPLKKMPDVLPALQNAGSCSA